MASPNPNAQRVTKMLVTVNGWIASGAIDKVQGQVLSELTFAKEERIMQLADQIGVVTEAELLSAALEISASRAATASSSPTNGPRGIRKGRPALNIGAVKDANATAEAARADEVESQADALLKAKRMRNLKRQSMPEKGLPPSVADQVQ